MRVDGRELPLCNPSLSAVSMSSLASQAHAFHQPVCQRLSWLHHWSVPNVHTLVSSPSEWGPDPQCQAAQIAHWTWWWQCLVVWHCRSVWSVPCHFAADAGGLALSMAKSRWHGALLYAHKSCTHGHMFWTRAGVCKTLCPQLPDSNTVWLQHCLAMTVTTVQIYDFNVILSKGNNSKIGDDWDKKKIRITYFFMRNQNMKFQNISIHGSKLMLYTIKQRH